MLRRWASRSTTTAVKRLPGRDVRSAQRTGRAGTPEPCGRRAARPYHDVMPSLPTKRSSSIKAIPWALLLEVAMLLRDRWMRLNPNDRAELSAIVKKSKGRPANLTPRERQRLGVLVRKLEPGALGRDLLPHARRLALRRGMRRGF